MLSCSLSLQTNSLSRTIAGWVQDLVSEHEQKTMDSVSCEHSGWNKLTEFSRTGIANSQTHSCSFIER